MFQEFCIVALLIATLPQQAVKDSPLLLPKTTNLYTYYCRAINAFADFSDSPECSGAQGDHLPQGVKPLLRAQVADDG
jgi:hypothetical protein